MREGSWTWKKMRIEAGKVAVSLEDKGRRVVPWTKRDEQVKGKKSQTALEGEEESTHLKWKKSLGV
jgi:hypothetical protein